MTDDDYVDGVPLPDDGDELAAEDTGPSDPIREEIQQRYRELVKAAEGDGAQRKALIETIAAEMAELRKADFDVWCGYVSTTLESTDSRIRRLLHRDLESLLAFVKGLPDGGSLLGEVDPILDLPIPGEERGDRISVRYASIPILLRLVSARTENAERAAIAANRMAVVVTALVEELSRRHVVWIDQLT